jgi:hypothetical protein
MTGYLEKNERQRRKTQRCPEADWWLGFAHQQGRRCESEERREDPRIFKDNERDGRVRAGFQAEKDGEREKHRRTGGKLWDGRGLRPKEASLRRLRRVSMLAIFPGRCQGCLIRFLGIHGLPPVQVLSGPPLGAVKGDAETWAKISNSCPESRRRVGGMDVSARLGKRTLVFFRMNRPLTGSGGRCISPLHVSAYQPPSTTNRAPGQRGIERIPGPHWTIAQLIAHSGTILAL